MAKRYSKFLPLIIHSCDLGLLNLVTYVMILFGIGLSGNDNDVQLFLIFSNCCWLLISLVTKNYIVNRPLVLSYTINQFLISFAYYLVVLLGILYFFQIYTISRLGMIVHIILFPAGVIFQRGLLFFILDYIRKQGYNHRKICLVGDREIAGRLMNSFREHPEYGYDLVEFSPGNTFSDYSEENIHSFFNENEIDEVYLCIKEPDPILFNKIFAVSKANRVKVRMMSGLVVESGFVSLVNYGKYPVLNLRNLSNDGLKIRILKRSFDLVFSATVMITGFPVFVTLMAASKITSKGPIFFRQQRVGRNGRPFNIYKFRSMYTDAEKNGPSLASDEDPRITPWGRVIRKTRLDELPQFYNVFKGDMSVVGPRPERQHFIEQILEKTPEYKKLLTLKPGITSIGQVEYGYAQTVDEMITRMRYDMLYLRNQKLRVDVSIIAKTVRVMVQGKGK